MSIACWWSLTDLQAAAGGPDEVLATSEYLSLLLSLLAGGFLLHDGPRWRAFSLMCGGALAFAWVIDVSTAVAVGLVTWPAAQFPMLPFLAGLGLLGCGVTMVARSWWLSRDLPNVWWYPLPGGLTLLGLTLLEWRTLETGVPDTQVHVAELILVAGLSGTLLTTVTLHLAITARRRTRDLTRMKEVVEHLGDAVIGLAADGRIDTWSGGAATLFGHPAIAVLGTGALALAAPEDRDPLAQVIGRAVAGQVVRNEELRFRTSAGQTFHAMLVMSPIRDSAGAVTGASAIVRDVTERKRLEAQLLQSQKMEALGRFTGGIAHDFNNLLTIIMGASELAAHDVGHESRAGAHLSAVRDAAHHASSLTRQLLAFSRQQLLQPVVIDLNAFVRNVRDMLTRLIGEDVDLVLDLAPHPLRVKVDPNQLTQVLLNLATNARDAMPMGGTLTIQTSGLLPNPEAGAPHDRCVALTVRDTGTGMPPDVVSKAFDPFFSTKPPGTGTGLGLSTVHGIVTQSGGEIAIETTPGQGTALLIRLPAASEPLPCAPPGRRVQSSPGARLLLVEDDDGVRAAVGAMLRRAGYHVREAPGARAARTLLGDRDLETVDLLLTDVTMPESSGPELARCLRARRPALRVLFMSGYAHEPQALVQGLLAGCHFIEKPFSQAELVAAVERALAWPLPLGAGAQAAR